MAFTLVVACGLDDAGPGTPSYAYTGPAQPWVFYIGLYTIMTMVVFKVVPGIFEASSTAWPPFNRLIVFFLGSWISLSIWLGYNSYYTSRLDTFGFRQARSVGRSAARLRVVAGAILLFSSIVAMVVTAMQAHKLRLKRASSVRVAHKSETTRC